MSAAMSAHLQKTSRPDSFWRKSLKAPNELLRSIRPLVQTFREVSQARILRLMELHPDDPSTRLELEREAHKLKGSLGSFGFPQGSNLAAELETLLSSEQFEQAEVQNYCRQILAVLDEESQVLTLQASETAIVLVFSSDNELLLELTATARDENIRILALSDPDQVEAFILTSNLTAAIVDLQSQPRDGRKLIETLSRSHASRVVALTSKDDGDALVEAAALGAWKVIDRSAPAQSILSFTRPLSRRGGSLRVMSVDDDPIVLAKLESTFESMGLNYRGLLHPERFWLELEEFDPDLLLLDLDLPGVGGLELCRAVRASARWGEVPLVVLTAHSDLETKYQVFRAGADDFIAKPISEPELRQRIANRLGGSRVEKERAERDHLTGLLTRSKALNLVQQMAATAERKGLGMSVAVVDLDRFKRINDTHGHAVGDVVLKTTAGMILSAFRDGDVVARWGGEEIVIAALQMTQKMMAERLSKVLKSVQAMPFEGSDGVKFFTSYSAGVAEYPVNGMEFSTLFDAADAALYRAKEEGRARVLETSSSTQSRRVAVTLVEDDSALAELIRHACDDRAISVEHFSTAGDFLTSQGGESPLRQNLLILDYDIPDLDGLSLYQRIRKAGTEQKVMMLSGRMGESETLRALELGADFCLAKPIHLSVLMQYIEKSLQS